MDGCYYLEQAAENQYSVSRPYDDSKGLWTVLDGDPKNLRKSYCVAKLTRLQRVGEAKMSDCVMSGEWKGCTPPPLPKE